MDARVFEQICSIVYDSSGIKIREGKQTMVSARIGQRLRALHLENEQAYLEYLQSDMEGELVELLDVISTNVTHFFREAEHFDYIREHVEARLAAGQRRFRFWSAACSMGHEPYTLAMMLQDVFEKAGHKVDARILATDISTRVLEKAMKGAYAADQVEKIPVSYRRKYMQESSEPGADFQVKGKLRDMVLFRRMNLSKPPFPMSGPMDSILVRNVMIYFDHPVRDAIVRECSRLLSPTGYLIVGKSESLMRSSDLFETAGPSVYRKRA